MLFLDIGLLNFVLNSQYDYRGKDVLISPSICRKPSFAQACDSGSYTPIDILCQKWTKVVHTESAMVNRTKYL